MQHCVRAVWSVIQRIVVDVVLDDGDEVSGFVCMQSYAILNICCNNRSACSLL